jgi:opacity protein-like surface antigen
MKWYASLAVAALATALEAPSGAAEEKDRSIDARRFYVFINAGNAFQAFDDFGDDIELEAPGGFNFELGGGAGYNFDDHWGIEFQADGIEPDLRSETLGKVAELSNITLVPAVRFRIPFLEGRLVTFATAGVGWSMIDLNDTANPQVKLDMDQDSIVGSLGAGVEYFLSEDVAFGIGARYFVHPSQDTTITVLDDVGRVTSEDTSTVNLTNVALLAHLRLFPGQAAGPGRLRRLFFADHGPFDTGATRFYIYALGGGTILWDGDFGGEVNMEAPGDFNATLGGGLGLNLSRNWGFEVQLVHTEPNLEAGALGKIAELSNLTVLPSVRYRYPLCGGRLVPFGVAGFGAAFNRIGDVRTATDVFVSPGNFKTVRAPQLDVQDSSFAGVVGLGVEYFFNHHLSIGMSVPVYFYPDWDTTITPRDGGAPQRGSANYSSVAALLLLKAYLP